MDEPEAEIDPVPAAEAPVLDIPETVQGMFNVCPGINMSQSIPGLAADSASKLQPSLEAISYP